MKFIVTVDYKEFEFGNCDQALDFALTVLESQKDNDDITMKFIKEE